MGQMVNFRETSTKALQLWPLILMLIFYFFLFNLAVAFLLNQEPYIGGRIGVCILGLPDRNLDFKHHFPRRTERQPQFKALVGISLWGRSHSWRVSPRATEHQRQGWETGQTPVPHSDGPSQHAPGLTPQPQPIRAQPRGTHWWNSRRRNTSFLCRPIIVKETESNKESTVSRILYNSIVVNVEYFKW